jgi:NAD(P)H-hydrate epimerase
MQKINQSYFLKHIKSRIAFGNKYTFGNVLIYAGSEGKWGAAMLASSAALRAGSGLVTALFESSSSNAFLEVCPEIMHTYQFEKDKIGSFDAIGVGSGLGKDLLKIYHLEYLLENYTKPLVLDADALNILSENTNLKSFLKPNHILTPHFGEASRLFGQKVSPQNALALGLEFVKKFPCILILKGPNSKIIDSNLKVYENASGNDALATAGSGDVLTGIITSFLGKGYKPIEAACLGVYVHGCLADECLQHQSKSSVIASDLIDSLKHFEI